MVIFTSFLLATLFASISAFGLGKSKPSAKLPLPTFNKETGRYEKSPLDDGKYPYDAIGAALRHGPSPFLTRVFNADEYEQGILKYMASAKVERAEATGNIDAKLNNAMDWAYQKAEVRLVLLVFICKCIHPVEMIHLCLRRKMESLRWITLV